MSATHPTLDSTIHSLAHHIAKIKDVDRALFSAVLEILVKNPEAAEHVVFALGVYENRLIQTGKVMQLEPFQKARNARRGAAS